MEKAEILKKAVDLRCDSVEEQKGATSFVSGLTSNISVLIVLNDKFDIQL
jgi:hypothetical protein